MRESGNTVNKYGEVDSDVDDAIVLIMMTKMMIMIMTIHYIALIVMMMLMMLLIMMTRRARWRISDENNEYDHDMMTVMRITINTMIY